MADLKAFAANTKSNWKLDGIGVARVPAGAPLASEGLAQERFDEGSNRRHAYLPSAMNAFAGRGDVAHEVGGGLQVPVGRIDVDVTHVGRECRHSAPRIGFDRLGCLAAHAPRRCGANSEIGISGIIPSAGLFRVGVGRAQDSDDFWPS